ncbi:MAG: FAD-dependent oxidoreductase, partial [Blastocatellia bacterium]
MTTRRHFLQQSPAFLTLPFSITAAKELRCDVAIIGGGLGGVAAALAALRNGQRVILTEETDWIGGQVTAQIVPPDEHRWIESFGGTQSWREYRRGIREYYRRHYPLTEAARALVNLNPGNGGVSRICHEPRVSVAVLESLLAPYLSGGRLTVLLRHKAIAADTQGNQVRGVTVRNLDSGREQTINAPYFLDATELGDLLPLTKTEYVTGFEARKQTGELHGAAQAQPLNMQAITWCFAMEHRAGEDHTIDPPEDYKFWRDYTPQLDTPWPGRMLAWEQTHPITLKPRVGSIDPENKGLPPNVQDFWRYRRIIDRRTFTPGSFTADATVVNWPMNDYFVGPIIEVSEAEITKHLRGARQLSLAWFYWLQTEAPRPDGGAGWRGLRLRPDITGTEDGFAKYPYIRESRRIQAEFTVLEQHVGTQARAAAQGKPEDEVTAENFADSVGVGSYRIDLHMSTGGNNYIDVSSLPFQIPLGALIPRRMENLIAACKNIGTTHITNGCYRLHPVEWNIGEAAGMLVAEALQNKQTPRGIRNTPKLLADFQARLPQQG